MKESKIMVKKKNIQITIPEPAIVEEVGILTDTHNRLESIKTLKGVIGYILRDATSATINLADPARVVEYAILSSTILETANQLADSLDLGEPKQILIQGDEATTLCLNMEDEKVSVFLENDADIKTIVKKLTR